MSNLLETASALQARQGHSRIGVLGTGDMAGLIAMCSDQASHREPGATSTSTSTTQPRTIVLLLVC
jgi:hypothetical protein